MAKRIRIVISGMRDGFAIDKTANALSALLKQPPEEITLQLRAKVPIMMKTADMQSAEKFRQMFERVGCNCTIDGDSSAKRRAARSA